MTTRHVVALSAGHYPSKPGASNKYIVEHHEAAIWVDELARELSKTFAAIVVPTGSLTSKVKFINMPSLAVDLALEIHFNACGGCGASGCETLYMPNSDLGLAAAAVIQKHLAPAMGNKDRGAKEGWYKTDKPGKVDYPGDLDGDEVVDYFLRATKPVALIIEPEFIDHYELIWARRNVACKALATAVKEIFNSWPLK